jgi:hypothetical protein
MGEQQWLHTSLAPLSSNSSLWKSACPRGSDCQGSGVTTPRNALGTRVCEILQGESFMVQPHKQETSAK